ncbi:HPr-rel-A system PqqD family peptide chaperone [Magnetofaba australis]|uniref:HPr-rel-A system PqqD family protein n=1 Tax=Magnetofaba australis IT-1 TaxID=1434232 RepID=A0A1Y2K808_9PROT|nr:HPr-rel-A system PqqD family peptide chaperone [Magnetofaba australis]OSM06868.1 hypothetical protein MAIT1_00256 [Magnetofaba australis IT-1]
MDPQSLRGFILLARHERLWRAIAGPFPAKRFEGGWILHNPLTAFTHLLNPAAFDALTALGKEALNSDLLAARLLQHGAAPDADAAEQLAARLLWELDTLGFIEPDPAAHDASG